MTNLSKLKITHCTLRLNHPRMVACTVLSLLFLCLLSYHVVIILTTKREQTHLMLGKRKREIWPQLETRHRATGEHVRQLGVIQVALPLPLMPSSPPLRWVPYSTPPLEYAFQMIGLITHMKGQNAMDSIWSLKVWINNSSGPCITENY